MTKISKWFLFILWFLLSGCSGLFTEIQPLHTLTVFPSPTPTEILNEPPSLPSFTPSVGYFFTFDYNFISTASVRGRGETCLGLSGPWNLTVEVTGHPEAGVTVETSGKVQFTLPEGSTLVEIEIPTAGTGTFQTATTTGTGDIQDPLLFRFELNPDFQGAKLTLISTGKGTITFHTPEGDRTIPYATVFTTQPQFEVNFDPNPNCR
ncbi:MAG: hypothetical protein WHS45_10550 [Anaerolinea sp.]|jgi:hypothetical protein